MNRPTIKEGTSPIYIFNKAKDKFKDIIRKQILKKSNYFEYWSASNVTIDFLFFYFLFFCAPKDSNHIFYHPRDSYLLRENSPALQQHERSDGGLLVQGTGYRCSHRAR